MECPICGHRNKSGTKFCIQCGHKFEEKSKSGLGVAGTTAVFVVAFLVIGAVGIFVWKAGILPGMTGSSSSHYNRNLSMWTLHESYTKDHFAPFGARPSSFQKNHQFP